MILVDFSSDNCPPCDAIRPILQRVLGDGRFSEIKFVEINLTRHPEFTERFMVFGVPTVMIFKEGKEYKRMVGYISEKKIVKLLEEVKK